MLRNMIGLARYDGPGYVPAQRWSKPNSSRTGRDVWLSCFRNSRMWSEMECECVNEAETRCVAGRLDPTRTRKVLPKASDPSSNELALAMTFWKSTRIMNDLLQQGGCGPRPLSGSSRSVYIMKKGRITVDRYLDAISQYATAVAVEAQHKTTYNHSIVGLEEAEGHYFWSMIRSPSWRVRSQWFRSPQFQTSPPNRGMGRVSGCDHEDSPSGHSAASTARGRSSRKFANED